MDPNLGLAARNDLLYIADHWADLRARLRPGGGNALTGMPHGGGDEGHCPIDVHVSDLLHEIENEARMLGHVLMDETDDWAPRTSRMPALLVDVAQRYGHWTAGDDERAALDFMDWAHEYAGKVRRALERPAPKRYMGPCRHTGSDGAGCAGELYTREGWDGATCRECGNGTTMAEYHQWLAGQIGTLRLPYTETFRALKSLDLGVSERTWERWTSSGTEAKPKVPRIQADADGLYPVAVAVRLALAGRQHAAKRDVCLVEVAA